MKQGWEIKKLGEVCTFCSGYTPKESELLECGAVPYFKVSDMNHCDNLKYLTHTSLFLEDGCKVYPKHTIVFPKNGAAIATNKKRILAQDSVVDLNTGGVVANDALVYFEYLYLYFLNLDFRLHTRRGAVPTLDIAELKNKSIPVPPREEQERIVEELDCLSGVIEKKREQLRELDALAQSIFYQMFGDPITNEKRWEVKILGEIVQSNMIGLTRSGAEQGESKQYLYFKMNNISNKGGVDFSKLTRVDASNSEIEKYSLSYGDFLFNTRNSFDLVGKSCVYNVRYGEIMVFNNNIMRIVFNQNVSTIYMAYLFQNRYISEQLDKIKKGTTSVWAIYYKDLEHILVNIPPFALQQEFADKIEAIEKQKELIKKSISETETLFNARMDYYFN